MSGISNNISGNDSKNDDTTINDYRPPCPVIFFERTDNKGQKQIFTIHCKKLNVNIECYVSTAVIKLEGIWTNPTNETLDCVFAVPTPGTVMNVTLQIGDERVLTTAIISNDDAREIMEQQEQKMDKKGNKGNKGNNNSDKSGIKEQIVTPENQSPYEQYVPDLFRLPFGNIEPNETIKLTCEYLEPLNYYKKGYVISLPLYFPEGTIIENKEWSEVVSVNCKIYALSKSTQPNCWTHEIETNIDEDNNIIEIKTISPKDIERMDDYPHYSETVNIIIYYINILILIYYVISLNIIIIIYRNQLFKLDVILN